MGMSEPRILLFDIETTPALAWVWSAYKTNIIDVYKDWELLSIAWKWLGEDEIFFEKKGGAKTDKALAIQLHALLDEADIVVAHNGDRFDLRKANARFLYHDLGPYSPVQSIDTLKESRRYFAELKHNLTEIGKRHSLGTKTPHTGFDLWLGCMNNDPDSWALMEKYNRQDVHLLEEVYLKLRPWIGTPGKYRHPNLGQWNPGELVCPKCGHDKLIKRGRHRTQVSVFQTYQCKNCGGYSRTRYRDPQPTQSDGVQAL